MRGKGDRVVVIGSGPCGLGAAWRLQELGHDNHIVLEASHVPGGLSVTMTDEKGFLWDMGGHVVFSHYQYFDRLLDYVVRDWCERERVCYIWQKERFIPYPLQNNIHRLPKEDVQRCLEGLMDVEKNKATLPRPKTFLDWLHNGFGTGILDVFLVPYNRKVWGYDPSEMNTEWMGERVATVDLKRVMSNVLTGKDDASWGPNNTFRFPLRAGTGAIYQNLYDKLDTSKFKFIARVVAVDADKSVITLSDGSVVAYDKLISTMPLDVLCGCIKGKGLDDLPTKAKHLKYSTTHVVGIGLDGQPPEKLRKQCWMYFPEDNCPFYRVTVFSNYSPHNVSRPGLEWSLMAEVCESPNRPVDTNTIIDSVIQGFIATKLITPSDRIISRFHRRLQHGYPTPFLGRDELCKPIFDALEQRGVYSRGRFGAWKYEVSNQDHTLMQGVEAVDHILFGSEEMTFRYPSVVNDRQWKNIGRVPRINGCTIRTHDPLALIQQHLSQCSFESDEETDKRQEQELGSLPLPLPPQVVHKGQDAVVGLQKVLGDGVAEDLHEHTKAA